MFIQTENTPNPNSLKFLPGRKVSKNGPLEVLDQEDTNNLLVKNLLKINGVTGVFFGEDFFSINKEENKKWEDIQHIVISYVNEHYANGNTCIIDKTNEEGLKDRPEAENLMGIYSSLSNQNITDTLNEFEGKNFSDLKNKLSDIIVMKLSPISKEIQKLLSDKNYIDQILADGAAKAQDISSKKVKKIKEIVGF